jgi:hypothetical protein
MVAKRRMKISRDVFTNSSARKPGYVWRLSDCGADTVPNASHERDRPTL